MHRRNSASKGRFGVAEPEGCASICERQSPQRTSNFRSLLSLMQTALKFLDEIYGMLLGCFQSQNARVKMEMRPTLPDYMLFGDSARMGIS